MVYGRYIELVAMVYKLSYNLGAPPCRSNTTIGRPIGKPMKRDKSWCRKTLGSENFYLFIVETIGKPMGNNRKQWENP